MRCGTVKKVFLTKIFLWVITVERILASAGQISNNSPSMRYADLTRRYGKHIYGKSWLNHTTEFSFPAKYLTSLFFRQTSNFQKASCFQFQKLSSCRLKSCYKWSAKEDSKRRTLTSICKVNWIEWLTSIVQKYCIKIYLRYDCSSCWTSLAEKFVLFLFVCVPVKRFTMNGVTTALMVSAIVISISAKKMKEG